MNDPCVSHGAQDEHYVAFFDHLPAARVHILVVPKPHIEELSNLNPPEELTRVGEHPEAKTFCTLPPKSSFLISVLYGKLAGVSQLKASSLQSEDCHGPNSAFCFGKRSSHSFIER